MTDCIDRINDGSEVGYCSRFGCSCSEEDCEDYY